MFWFLLIAYFVGLLVFVELLQALNENKDSMGLMLSALGLCIALLLLSAHLWYAFYVLMLLPWFTFLPAIPELNFWGIYIAFALLRGGISIKSK
jgi:hypothetical protein